MEAPLSLRMGSGMRDQKNWKHRHALEWWIGCAVNVGYWRTFCSRKLNWTEEASLTDNHSIIFLVFHGRRYTWTGNTGWFICPKTWVGLTLIGYSTILPSCTATSAKFQSALAELGRQWNTQNPSQPNPGLRGDESPCTKVQLSIWCQQKLVINLTGHPIYSRNRI